MIKYSLLYCSLVGQLITGSGYQELNKCVIFNNLITAESNIFGLRIFGNGISTSSVSASEVAILISSFEKLIIDNAKAQNPDIDVKQLPALHFHEVKDESVGIFLIEDITKTPERLRPLLRDTFFSLGVLIQTNITDQIGLKPLTHLVSIQSIVRKYDAYAELKWNEENVATFNKNSDFETARAVTGTYSGKTTIIARLDDVGGVTPNIHIDINGKSLVVYTTRELAKKLAPSLYDDVVLRGTATWDIQTDEIIKFTLDDYQDFRVGGTYDAILKLRKLTGGHWDNFNSDEEINEALLRD